MTVGEQTCSILASNLLTNAGVKKHSAFKWYRPRYQNRPPLLGIIHTDGWILPVDNQDMRWREEAASCSLFPAYTTAELLMMFDSDTLCYIDSFDPESLARLLSDFIEEERAGYSVMEINDRGPNYV